MGGAGSAEKEGAGKTSDKGTKPKKPDVFPGCSPQSPRRPSRRTTTPARRPPAGRLERHFDAGSPRDRWSLATNRATSGLVLFARCTPALATEPLQLPRKQPALRATDAEVRPNGVPVGQSNKDPGVLATRTVPSLPRHLLPALQHRCENADQQDNAHRQGDKPQGHDGRDGGS